MNERNYKSMVEQRGGPMTVAAIENLIRRDRGRDALRILRQSPPPDASAAEVKALEALALAGRAEFDAATQAANQALALDSRSAHAYQALGTVAAMQRQPGPASRYFSQALEADRSYAPAYHALGLLLLEGGNRAEAAIALRAANALSPGDWRYNAGVALLEPPRQRALALRAAYRAALAEQPGSLSLRFRLLGTYLAMPFAPLLGTASATDPRLGVAAYQTILSQPVVLTYAFLVANVAMFAFLQTHGGSEDTATLVLYGAKDGSAIVHQGQWWRLVTPMFLHAGITHLLVNSISLYYVGVLYERCVGQARFLYCYFFAGVGGSLLSVACSNSIGVGASGAIFGIFGALGVYFFRNRALFGPIARGLVRQVAFLTALNLAIPLVVSNIDEWAHIGGLLAGIVAGIVAGPLLAHSQPGLDPDAALAERRPLATVLAASLVAALAMVVLVALVIHWNPAGA